MQAGKDLLLWMPTTEIVSVMLVSLTRLALESLVTIQPQVPAFFLGQPIQLLFAIACSLKYRYACSQQNNYVLLTALCAPHALSCPSFHQSRARFIASNVIASEFLVSSLFLILLTQPFRDVPLPSLVPSSWAQSRQLHGRWKC